MLVNKKQEFDVYYQEQNALKAKAKLEPNLTLRKKCFTIVIMLMVIAVFATIRSGNIIQAGYELVHMKSQAVKLEKENESLRLEVSKLRSPERIQYIAANELGLVVPQSVYCVNVKDNQDKNENQDKTFASKILSALKSKAEAGSRR